MTDENLARALHGAGILPKETLHGAARARKSGENLAGALVRLGLVHSDDILRFDPQAFSDGAASDNGAASNGSYTYETAPQAAPDAADVGISKQDGANFDGDFIVEGAEGGEDPLRRPWCRWANELLRLAITMGSSDIHLEPRADGLLPRYRMTVNCGRASFCRPI